MVKLLEDGGAVDSIENNVVVGIALCLCVLPVLICTFTPGLLESIGSKQLFPNIVDPVHELAYSRSRHNHGLNKAIHGITNPLVFLIMVSMLDFTPTVASLSSIPTQFFELNAAGIYLLFTILHYLYIDGLRSIPVVIAITGLYELRGYLNGLLGDGHLSFQLVLYFFSQGVQIFPGHLPIEGRYEWNIFHIFILQQFITWYQIFMAIGMFPVLNAQVDKYKVLYEKDFFLFPITKRPDPGGLKVRIYRAVHWFNQHLMPHYSSFDLAILDRFPALQNLVASLGLLQLVVHRKIMEAMNLYPAPLDDLRKSWCANKKRPQYPLKFRPDDGFGTDYENPTAAVTGFAIGRNVATEFKEFRDHRDDPDVQLVAQRLLAREEFAPAGDQLNIIAAAWIQAQVHGWMGHMEGKQISLDNGEGICPLGKVNFFATKERRDGHYNSERSQWWDASFLYGQNQEENESTRSNQGGKLKVNTTNPDTLASRSNGTYYIGDNKNSWVGIDMLKELFLKEHNHICDLLAAKYPSLTDDELYGYARNIMAVLNAKIHTIDWTPELLKTNQLKIGMLTNWIGLTKATFGESAPGTPFKIIGKKKAENRGVPFCLTEEFAAVYRLHPLCPPGIVLEKSDEKEQKDEFVSFASLTGEKGRNLMRRSAETPKTVMKSMYSYPCGALVGANYPDALRQVNPTDAQGIELGDDMKVDLAAIDLYRDRERGIPKYNEFRRQLHLPAFKSWEKMTGDAKSAKKLEAIYGPAPLGIEKCDLLVGDLYEKKIDGFAISETSFLVFVLMASRRLDADPFLNELYDEEHYTEFGLEYIEETGGLLDVLKRHYPDIAAPFVERNQSAFKPLYGPDKWSEAIESGVVDSNLINIWKKNKAENDAYFEGLASTKSGSTKKAAGDSVPDELTPLVS